MAKREKRNGQGQLAARPRPRHALPTPPPLMRAPRVAPGPSTWLAPESSHGLDTTETCRQASRRWLDLPLLGGGGGGGGGA